jgi:hypothetical protein
MNQGNKFQQLKIIFPKPLLNKIGGGFLLSVDLGCKGKTVAWFEYGIVGTRLRVLMLSSLPIILY